MNSYLILADVDFSAILAVFFVFVSIAGWIGNLINSQRQQQQVRGAQPQGGRPREERIQSEIEKFLQEANRQRAEQQQHQPEGERRVSVDEIQVVERRRPAAEPAQPAVKKYTDGRRRRPGPETGADEAGAAERAEPRPLAEQQAIGGTIRKRHHRKLRTKLGPRIGETAPDVAAPIGKHLGSAIGRAPLEAIRSTAERRGVSPFLEMLQSPSGARQAIVMSEILQRPRLLRRSR